jgi:hypothetical protein
LKETNIIVSNVPGSSSSRVAMRNQIRALIVEKGLPSFYITSNPADVFNPLVKFLAGANIDIYESKFILELIYIRSVSSTSVTPFDLATSNV